MISYPQKDGSPGFAVVGAGAPGAGGGGPGSVGMTGVAGVGGASFSGSSASTCSLATRKASSMDSPSLTSISTPARMFSYLPMLRSCAYVIFVILISVVLNTPVDGQEVGSSMRKGFLPWGFGLYFNARHPLRFGGENECDLSQIK